MPETVHWTLRSSPRTCRPVAETRHGRGPSHILENPRHADLDILVSSGRFAQPHPMRILRFWFQQGDLLNLTQCRGSGGTATSTSSLMMISLVPRVPPPLR